MRVATNPPHFVLQIRLLTAYLTCRKHKASKLSTLQYGQNFEHNLARLRQAVINFSYTPKVSTCFVVTRPKQREVFAADFSDRVAHHLVIQALEPILDCGFIATSYACRKTKGTHKAINHLQTAMRKLSKSATRNTYFLQLDVKSFFTGIDKNILQNILQSKIRNPTLNYLAREIVSNDPTKNCVIKGNPALLNHIPPHKSLFHASKHKGLPIGNLTSQVFANVYLNLLDQFIKRQLKVKYYFRYVDDMVLLSKDPSQLNLWREQINDFLKTTLDLELHPDKDKTGSVYQGIDFLGYVVKPTCILVRKRVVQNLTTKLYLFNQKYKTISNQPTDRDTKKMLAVINSYYGHFIHANSYNLRKTLYQNHFGILKDYLIPKDPSYNSFKIKTKMDIPLYKDLSDLLRYLYSITRNFPKEHRYNLGKELSDLCWKLLDKILITNKLPNTQKAAEIKKVSTLFDILKTRLRMVYDIKLLSHKQYAHIITKTEVIGKSISNWLNWAIKQKG